MIRVGVDFHTWSGIYQGSRSHILGLYRAAILEAPDIEFIFFGENLHALAVEYVEFTRSNVSLVHMQNAGGMWRLLVQLPLLAFKYRLTILHTQYRIPIFTYGMRACTIHDILTETHPEFFSSSFSLLARWMFKFSARCADIVFTVSDFSKSELVRLYGVLPDRARVTYNGVDTAIFNPQAASENVLAKYGLRKNGFWLSVGRIEPRKNHLNAMRAWRKYEKNDRQLVIVGQKDFGFKEVYTEAKQDGNVNSIIFLDSVTNPELAALYADCHCLLYPSYAEGFGMPVIEALACGAPVITSSTTSLPEVGGTVSHLVDPYLVDDIVQAMEKVDHGSGNQQERLDQAAKFNWMDAARVLVTAFRAISSKEDQ